MKKFTGVILSTIVFSIIVGSLAINHDVAYALSTTGPGPIPGNIFPIPDNSTAIIPNNSTVPTTPDNSTAIIPSNSSNISSTSTSTHTSELPTVNIAFSPTVQSSNTVLVTNTVSTISQVQSGLVVKDPLNNQTENKEQLLESSKYWIFGGDAPAENATYALKQDDKAGLHIGMKAPSNGTWAGFYAASPDTNATLFHAVITTPVRTIPYQYYENGLYVQTSQQMINYVTCVAVTSHAGTVWAIVSTTGNANQAVQFNVLWADTSVNQPLTRDCAIVTNGQNMLKVYLDHVLVYSSNTLVLGMPSPFNAYLEPQTSFNGKLLTGKFANYYATTDENMTVTNNPVNATVKLTSSQGDVLATATADAFGTATFDMAKYAQPMNANIEVYDTTNTQIASTSSAVNIWGGDVYKDNFLSVTSTVP